MKVLFVCTSNRLRSPTAETLFSGWRGVETASAGLDGAATLVLNAAMVEAADAIFVMERHHRDKLRKRFRDHLGKRPVFELGIPDDYERDQPELIALLKDRVAPLLESLLNPDSDLMIEQGQVSRRPDSRSAAPSGPENACAVPFGRGNDVETDGSASGVLRGGLSKKRVGLSFRFTGFVLNEPPDSDRVRSPHQFQRIFRYRFPRRRSPQ